MLYMLIYKVLHSETSRILDKAKVGINMQ